MIESGRNETAPERESEKPVVPVWEEHGFQTRVALDRALREKLVPYDKRQQILGGQAAIPPSVFDNKPIFQEGQTVEHQTPVSVQPALSDGRSKTKDNKKPPKVIEAPPRKMNPLKSGTYVYDPEHPVVIGNSKKPDSANSANRELMLKKLAQMRNHSQGK